MLLNVGFNGKRIKLIMLFFESDFGCFRHIGVIKNALIRSLRGMIFFDVFCTVTMFFLKLQAGAEVIL